MDTYYAIIKIKLMGDIKDLYEITVVGENIVEEIKENNTNTILNDVTLQAVGKENPFYFDINPLLED